MPEGGSNFDPWLCRFAQERMFRRFPESIIGEFILPSQEGKREIHLFPISPADPHRLARMGHVLDVDIRCVDSQDEPIL